MSNSSASSNTGIVISEVGVNSYSSALAGSASFTGTAENISRFPEATINLAGSPSVAPGTFYFEYSPDGINWDVSISYTLAGPNSFVPLPLRTVLPFFRVRYVNGSTALTALRLTTVYFWNAAKNITRVLNQSIDENEPVENVRSFVGGRSPNGGYTNLPATGEVASQSTMTPLGIGGVFNAAGTIVDMSGYVAVGVTLQSNVNSSTNGIVFSWYDDSVGTTLIKTSTFTYASAPLGSTFQVPRQGPYLRLTYTNGAVAQASFTFLARLFVSPPPSDVLSISEVITGNTAAQIVKANIVGQQENGIFANVGLSNSASAKVAVTDRPSEVRGRVRVIIPINRTTLVVGGTTIYTVTAGKTLYISNLLLTALNDSTAIGEYRLRDNTTVLSSFLLTSRVAATPSAGSSIFPNLPEPIPFVTNVNLILITGVIDVAGFLEGYEETT